MNPYLELSLLLVLITAAYCLGRIRGIRARLDAARVLRLVWAVSSIYLNSTWGNKQSRSRHTLWEIHDAVLEYLQKGKVRLNVWGKPVKGIAKVDDQRAAAGFRT